MTRVLTGLAVAGLAAGGLTIAPPAQAAPADARPNCTKVKTQYVGNGWYLNSPGYDATRGSGFTCYLELGDRNSAVRWLQYTIGYCYSEPLGDIVANGHYNSRTRSYVREVQSASGVPETGVYGPRTRSGMSWRMFNPAKKAWSENCYRPV